MWAAVKPFGWRARGRRTECDPVHACSPPAAAVADREQSHIWHLDRNADLTNAKFGAMSLLYKTTIRCGG
jgi:hypothetical protein